MLLAPLSALAQDSQELEKLQQDLRQSQSQTSKLSTAAAALAQEVAALQDQLVARAAAARDEEGELDRLQDQLTLLAQRQAAQQAELARRRQALGLSLAALQRLALTPPFAALVATSPLEIARGELLLGPAAAELQRRTRVLEGDIAALKDTEGQISEHRRQAAALAGTLDLERQKITWLLAERADLQQRTAAEAAASQARSAKLAAEAKDLRDLLDRLAKERAAAPPPAAGPSPVTIRGFPTTPGSLVSPVTGPIVGGFGVPDLSGSRAKGILIQTKTGAPVLAPFDGQIVYRGPFRGYGEILIIQHSGGYHTVLAGLGRSDAAVGQWVIAGEPVGTMGPSADGKTKLYIELRLDGHPIDPAPWLGKSDIKVE
jgi:septal ring factor EnvC (AmiA/AmiB activator)